MNEFLSYLSGKGSPVDRLPSLEVLSAQLGVSKSKLREQMEVARCLGLIEVRPHTGMRRAEYTFAPALRASLSYAVATDASLFDRFGELRTKVEMSFLKDAAARLTAEDHEILLGLITRARAKLATHPVHIPHEEHRQLHLTIYSRLGNPFVIGVLQAYWDMYEAVGLSLYADLTYLQKVWDYHELMVEAIRRGDFAAAERALLDHTRLLRHREAEGQEAAIRSSVSHS
jgi:DNA-binding FadR family transcriptional regulator